MIFSSSIPANVRTPTAAVNYLANRFTYHSIDKWTEIIREGRVFINGERCNEFDRVKGGDTIAYNPGEFEEPAADLSYTIIYEDEWILCVNKPANLLVHRAGRSFRNNLVYQLRYMHTPPYPDCHPIHRLDRDTSGAILIAKNSESMRVFGKMFSDGTIVRKYKALVCGCPVLDVPFVIDSPIAADKNSGSGIVPCKFKVDDSGAGKEAATIIEDVFRLDSGLSILTVRPLTGRTHQIRVHLAHTGFPIAGDRVYGLHGANWLRNEERPYCKVFTRLALHCESLSFTHPCTGQECCITAELPIDFVTSSTTIH